MADAFEKTNEWIDSLAGSELRVRVERRHANGLAWLAVERPKGGPGSYQVCLNAAKETMFFLYSFFVGDNLTEAFQLVEFTTSDVSGLNCGTYDGMSVTLFIGATLRPYSHPMGILLVPSVAFDVLHDFERAVVTTATVVTSVGRGWKAVTLPLLECSDFSEAKLMTQTQWAVRRA